MANLTICNGKATFQCKHYDLTVEDGIYKIEFKLNDENKDKDFIDMMESAVNVSKALDDLL